MSSDGKAATATATAIDPITFEVIRNKLAAITEEQAITLKSASGSPVVTDATDFNNGIYLVDGSIVTMGPQVLFHSGTMSAVIRSITAELSENPGIEEGDMFILNDPYRGAVHQPDVSIVAPIFYDGEHVAWTGTCAHQLDVGGMSFGGWAAGATEVQQEAMLLSGIKLVEAGVLRQDLWQMILGMSRLPTLLGLDLKAMIAANNVAIGRVRETMTRYGAETVAQVMESEIESSERSFRRRLSALPDGTWRAVDFIEHDGHDDRLYEIRIAVEKRGDGLVVDLAGSSPQAPGFINCTRAGLNGAVFASILPILAPDIRWNEGIMRAVEVRASEGIICNATRPAPVSMATTGTMWVVANATIAAVSRLAACAEETRCEAIAVTKGSMVVFTLAGKDRRGEPYGTFLLDSTAGGGGAYEDHDGLDGSGDFNVPRPSITNVEANEANGPLIYLYRSLLPDSGGPGRQRGGATVGIAVAPHGVEGLDAMMVGHGMRVPNSAGLLGGHVGSCNFASVTTVTAGTAPGAVGATGPEDLAAAGEREDLGPKPGRFRLGDDQVFAYSFQGGGGFGDPLARDPEAVAADVEAGLVSVVSASEHYGVVLGQEGVEAEATAARRAELRRRRLGEDPQRAPVEAGIPLVVDAQGAIACACGEHLAAAGEDWKEAAVTRVADPAEQGPLVRVREELELRTHACPACATLLETELVRCGEPHLQTHLLLPWEESP